MKQIFTKSEEIAILETLKNSDTYFKNCFEIQDIDKMICNIQNDFHLLFDTSISNRLHQLEEDLKDKVSVLDEYQNNIQELSNNLKETAINNLKNLDTIKKFAVRILCENDHDSQVYSILDMREIIMLKVNENISLNQTDLDYIFKNLS